MRRVLSPARFFISAGASLRVETLHDAAEVWELFGAQLLGSGQTREQATFNSWALYVDEPDSRSEQPLVEIKWQESTEQLHVTRSLQVYAWEAFESQPSVIESRLAKTWIRELVASIDLARVPDADAVEAELTLYVEQAITGTSRLAITSLENPLPQFALGQLGYLPHVKSFSQSPICDPLELFASDPSNARSLELALRATERADIAKLADVVASCLEQTSAPGAALSDVCTHLFNDVALSPYTVLVDNWVDLLIAYAGRPAFGPRVVVDTMSYMLRHLVRHLTAFDLVTFHNQGANYPDALFLDRLLQAYVKLIDANGELFEGANNRMRRRALRQAYWMRRSLESVRFPDAPTSPGGNRRVLPDAFPQVPEQQIDQPDTRHRQLFEVGSTERLVTAGASETLAASLGDLTNPMELRELGMAVFLDRPLGFFKPPGDPDRTPLVSYEAFSRRIAASRLDDLFESDAASKSDRRSLLERLPSQSMCQGVPVSDVGSELRPGVVSLTDASLVSDDFVFLRTTRSSLDDLLTAIGADAFAPIEPDLHRWLTSDPHVLLIRTQDHLLAGFDRQMQKRMTIKAIGPIEYELRLGVERFRHGIRIERCSRKH